MAKNLNDLIAAFDGSDASFVAIMAAAVTYEGNDEEDIDACITDIADELEASGPSIRFWIRGIGLPAPRVRTRMVSDLAKLFPRKATS